MKSIQHLSAQNLGRLYPIQCHDGAMVQAMVNCDMSFTRSLKFNLSVSHRKLSCSINFSDAKVVDTVQSHENILFHFFQIVAFAVASNHNHRHQKYQQPPVHSFYCSKEKSTSIEIKNRPPKIEREKKFSLGLRERREMGE